jgi:hypothetical protein
MSHLSLSTALRAIVTLGVAGLIAAGPQGAASAAVDRTCGSGKFCVYKHSPFQIDDPGDYMYKADAANNDWTAAWDYVVNQDSSWWNRWTVDVHVYDHNFFASGWTVCVPAATAISYNAYGNDDGMSHKWNGSSC